MKSIYKITFLLLLLPLISFANDNDKKHEKSKTITKKYTVNSNALVALDNKYGDLNITTWDKNRVEIEVKITVKGDDLEDVEQKLNSINIEFNASNSKVSAQTVFGEKKSNWSWWKRSKNVNYKINYIVKMPKTNSVDLDNDYGSIYLGNISGSAAINCDYGKIVVGELTSNKNDINLDYCSTSTISYMKNGDVNIDYSKLSIDNSQNIRANADYSTLKFDKAGTVDFNADYGSITINEADNINGNSDYVSLRFGTVRKNLTIDTEYGSLTVKNLAKNFEKVDVSGQYTGIKIYVEPKISFNFEIDLQYGSFKRNNDNIELFKSNSKSTKKYYEGKYGKGNPSGNLKINSQYGSVRIEEN
ncbi:hypothetical protein H9I45_04790 [Polaribacter haliotis]|uniref:Adhesin domain-containing protein n=1 Tax=Polaribacter haliotis TaxID=1888915 RepID=A0A7L8AIH1_9FLAO|nr:hypothetical protein [Polaribacter haliotis]QOD61767.1 hypothetical protein H9I45_04790 [Polaribacter haliotis]